MTCHRVGDSGGSGVVVGFDRTATSPMSEQCNAGTCAWELTGDNATQIKKHDSAENIEW